METYRGLVLAQRSAGDKGKFIDILTEQNTVQEVYVRGGKKASSSALSATQQFSYATFSISKRGDRCYFDSATPIRIFYRLRESLARLSLAVYFCDLTRFTVRDLPVPQEQCEIMRLMLNTLHYLENGLCDTALLKPIFELRLMTELGMMPDILICRGCGAYLPHQLYFYVRDGYYRCASCAEPDPEETPIFLHAPVLQAMRHIIFADFQRLYRFRLGAKNLAALQRCVEQFTLYHLDLVPRSLTFYHEVTDKRQSETLPNQNAPDGREKPAEPSPTDI